MERSLVHVIAVYSSTLWTIFEGYWLYYWRPSSMVHTRASSPCSSICYVLVHGWLSSRLNPYHVGFVIVVWASLWSQLKIFFFKHAKCRISTTNGHFGQLIDRIWLMSFALSELTLTLKDYYFPYGKYKLSA